MGHPDFRVRGKIFATLAYPTKSVGMVKLKPEQQVLFVEAEPDVFRPVDGAWGERGATYVQLRQANQATVLQALRTAWRNTAPKSLADLLEDRQP
jgi:hypothetical protein